MEVGGRAIGIIVSLTHCIVNMMLNVHRNQIYCQWLGAQCPSIAYKHSIVLFAKCHDFVAGVDNVQHYNLLFVVVLCLFSVCLFVCLFFGG